MKNKNSSPGKHPSAFTLKNVGIVLLGMFAAIGVAILWVLGLLPK
ncbi:MAG: hypothetical protein ACI9AR_000366 [Flavobacteriaceae bacterium]|jgi:hypothetical protein